LFVATIQNTTPKEPERWFQKVQHIFSIEKFHDTNSPNVVNVFFPKNGQEKALMGLRWVRTFYIRQLGKKDKHLACSQQLNLPVQSVLVCLLSLIIVCSVRYSENSVNTLHILKCSP
jgi:hypothetical protein